MLRRFGIPVVAIPGANSFEDVRAEMRTVAKAVGELDRGEELIAQFDAKLTQLRASAVPNGGITMQYRSGGYTAGSNIDADGQSRGIVAKLSRAIVVGPIARLELIPMNGHQAQGADGERLIEAQIPAQQYRAMGLKEGETLVVTPRQAKVFVDYAANI